MILEYFLVFVLSILAGGWAIPAGLLFDLDPLGVYVAATLGSLAFTSVFVVLGGPARDRVIARLFPGAEEKVAASRAGGILDRYGVVGLAVIGSTLLGPTITLLAALIFGVDRRRFLIWYAGATIVGFALMTLFWVAVI